MSTTKPRTRTVGIATGKPQRLGDVPALILAGGLGTRLRSAVANVPKVLAPVRGRPFLAHLLDRLVDAGLRRGILLTGYQADEVEATFGASCGPLLLDYSRELSPLGTGGALRQALAMTPAETILLLNGDSWCDVEHREFFAVHQRRAADVSMVVTSVDNAGRYGAIRLDATDTISGFEEKRAGSGPGWINAGVYLIQRHLIETLPGGRLLSLERDCLPRWVERANVVGFRSAGPFLDIGTPESYAAAESFFCSECGTP